MTSVILIMTHTSSRHSSLFSPFIFLQNIEAVCSVTLKVSLNPSSLLPTMNQLPSIYVLSVLIICKLSTIQCFVFAPTRTTSISSRSIPTFVLYDQIVSPFDEADGGSGPSTTTTAGDDDEFLDLTYDNVEMVLDTMRDYLIQDGGNVVIGEIDGPIVKLELQGACGTCPSSTMTLKMGLERGLKERIPEIQEVIQVIPDGPSLEEEEVDVILNGVRPFLDIAGGQIDCVAIEGVGGLQPTIMLNMKGKAAALRSVKMEIVQRLQRHFMIPGLRVEYEEEDLPW